MFSKVSIASPTIFVLVLGLLAPSVGPLPGEAGGVSAPQILRADQLTKQQFEVLPDSAVIEFKGQRMTKAQLRAKAAKSTEAMAKGQAAARAPQARVSARHAQFLQQQQAKLQADNAKVQAELARFRQARTTPQARQLEAIEQEAAQLWQRSQRAAQLLQQLQQLGR